MKLAILAIALFAVPAAHAWCAHGKDVATGQDYRMFNFTQVYEWPIYLKALPPQTDVQYTAAVCKTGIVPDTIGKDDKVYCYTSRDERNAFAASHGSLPEPFVAWGPTVNDTRIVSVRKLEKMHTVCHVSSHPSEREHRWVCHQPEDAEVYEATPRDGDKFHIACHHYVGWYENVCHVLRDFDIAYFPAK